MISTVKGNRYREKNEEQSAWSGEESAGYEDIINLPHHVSKTHPQMPLSNRAAQFAPFAALTGYDDAVAETARLTDRRLDLDEDEKAQINEKLQQLLVFPHQKVSMTHFVRDAKKEGGEYIITSGIIKKIDTHARRIDLMDGTMIAIEDIILIEI